MHVYFIIIYTSLNNSKCLNSENFCIEKQQERYMLATNNMEFLTLCCMLLLMLA